MIRHTVIGADLSTLSTFHSLDNRFGAVEYWPIFIKSEIYTAYYACIQLQIHDYTEIKVKRYNFSSKFIFMNKNRPTHNLYYLPFVLLKLQHVWLYEIHLTLWKYSKHDELSLPLNYSLSYIVWLYFQSYEKYSICHKILNVIYKCHQYVNIWFVYFDIIHDNNCYAKIYRLGLCCNR